MKEIIFKFMQKVADRGLGSSVVKMETNGTTMILMGKWYLWDSGTNGCPISPEAPQHTVDRELQTSAIPPHSQCYPILLAAL